jgi:hypothetical protein
VGDSIARANRGARILSIGGSNTIGEGTTGAPTVSRPANVTSRFLVEYVATTVEDWSTLTQHGSDVYLVHELVQTHGYTDPIVLCNHGVASTTAGTWESTHAAAAITSWQALGVAPPNIVVIASGGQDSASIANRDAFAQNSLDMWGKFAEVFGAGFARIILESPKPQTEGNFEDDVRALQRAQARNANDCSIFVAAFGLYDLVDEQHRSPAGNAALAAVLAPLIFPLLQ